MKIKRKLLSALMCVCLVFCLFAGTAMADTTTSTGSITIENQSGTNATVAGKTLKLFKIFNATTDGENISYQWIEENGVNKYESFFFGDNGVIYEKNADGSYKLDDQDNKIHQQTGTIHDVVDYINSIKDDSFEFSQMAAKLHTYIHANHIEADQVSDSANDDKIDADATSYTFTDLSLGYYLIYDATDLTNAKAAVRSAAMLAHPGENKKIYLKADRPHIVKYVDDSDTATADWKLGTTASIGDVVTFRIATAIPNHDLYGENYTFVITDKMSDHLELINTEDDPITVIVTEPTTATDDNGTSTIANANYTIKTTGLSEGEDFKVTITNITQLSPDTTVEIIYKARVTATAEKTNANNVILTYSNDPNNPASTGSVEASANVHLWQFTLTKHMEDATGVPSFIRLGGAEFQIFKDGDLQNPLKFSTKDVSINGKTFTQYTLNPAGSITTIETVNAGDDGKTDIGYTDGGSLGQILIYGLGEGTYVIRETKAPAGYQVADGNFIFTLKDEIGITGAIGNAEIETTHEDNASRTVGKFTRVLVDETNHKYYIGITNAPGSTLPETGGMGTTLFMVLGVVIMAGAISLFLVRRKRTA